MCQEKTKTEKDNLIPDLVLMNYQELWDGIPDRG